MKHTQSPRSITLSDEMSSMSNLNRFLGGSPGSVLVKLIFLSLLVGAFLAFLGITPLGLIEGLFDWIASMLRELLHPHPRLMSDTG